MVIARLSATVALMWMRIAQMSVAMARARVAVD